MNKVDKSRFNTRLRAHIAVIVIIIALRLFGQADFLTSVLRDIFEPIQSAVSSTISRDDSTSEVSESVSGAEVQSYGAQIVYKNTLGYQKVGTINIGTDQGVSTGDHIVQGGALVGIVDEVFRSSADIRFVGDPSLKIAAKIEGVDQEAIVSADIGGVTISNLAVFEESIADKAAVTSGLDGVYVEGLLIGRVGSKIEDEGALERYVIRPAFSLQDVRSVEVLSSE